MARLLAKRSDNKFNVKLAGFGTQLQATDVSSHTEELWYNETLWMTIYIYIYNIYIYIYIYQAHDIDIVTRVEITDETVYISNRANAFKNLCLFQLSKQERRLSSTTIVWSLVNENEKLLFKHVKLPLKTNLVSHTSQVKFRYIHESYKIMEHLE